MTFPENNAVGATVVEITADEGVSLNIIVNPDNAFGINGNLLVANKVLDYEVIIPLTGIHIAHVIGITLRARFKKYKRSFSFQSSSTFLYICILNVFVPGPACWWWPDR